MAAMFRRGAHWIADQGPDYDLRELHGGHPTGRVARLAWPGEVEQVRGRGVSLYAEGNRLTLVERAEPGRSAIRLHLPRRSIVDATVVPEPGTPRVMVTLTVQFGPSRFPVQLWFDAAARPVLERILRRTPPHPTPHQAHEPRSHPVPRAEPDPGHRDVAGREPRAEQESSSRPGIRPASEGQRAASSAQRPAAESAPELAPLTVHPAPVNENWLVFRPGPCAAEVLLAPPPGSGSRA